MLELDQMKIKPQKIMKNRLKNSDLYFPSRTTVQNGLKASIQHNQNSEFIGIGH